MKAFFLTEQKKTQYKLFAGDACAILLSIFLAYGLRIFFDGNPVTFKAVWERTHWLSLSFFLLYPLILYVAGYYSPQQRITKQSFFRLSLTLVLSVAVAAMLLFFVPRYLIGRKVLMFQLPFLIAFLTLSRYLLLNLANTHARTNNLCVIGDRPLVNSFIQEAKTYPEYTIKDFSFDAGSAQTGGQEQQKKVNEIITILNKNAFDCLAIDSTLRLSEDEINEILDLRFHKEKEIYDLVKLYETLSGKVPIQYIDGRWFISNFFFQGPINQVYYKSKRLIDLVCSSLLIILLSPLMLLIALLIKVSSKGPTFYIQQRIGMDRKLFRFYKFRTMIDKAEAMTGPQHSQAKDPRLTLVGRFLRKARLDEIPQLINILKGEMSFIGPRPIRAYFADQFSKEIPYYELRHYVKPGLTGWAQVHGCYAVPYGLEALQYELFYIQHMSLILDLHIFFKTVKTVFRGEGK